MTDKEIEAIIKPIFTKMFNSNFSACEYGIECYKKGLEYQGIKELTIENDNLIKQVRKLEEQIEQLQRINSEQKETLKKVRIALIQERTANIVNYGKGGVEMFDDMLEVLKGVSN